MPEWLASRLPAGWTGWEVTAVAVVFGILSAVVSIFAVGYFLARLPADYFTNPAARARVDRHPIIHALLAVGRNLMGYFLILLGMILSLPGVPGQGLLTIFMGVMLIDFPGKTRLEWWLLTRRPVLRGVNKLRGKFGKPPLDIPQEEPKAEVEKPSVQRPETTPSPSPP